MIELVVPTWMCERPSPLSLVVSPTSAAWGHAVRKSFDLRFLDDCAERVDVTDTLRGVETSLIVQSA